MVSLQQRDVRTECLELLTEAKSNRAYSGRVGRRLDLDELAEQVGDGSVDHTLKSISRTGKGPAGDLRSPQAPRLARSFARRWCAGLGPDLRERGQTDHSTPRPEG